MNYKQPKLHDPVILDYNNLSFPSDTCFAILTNTYLSSYELAKTNSSALSTNSATGSTNNVFITTTSTNSYPYLVVVRGTNVTEYPPVTYLKLLTNGTTVFPVAGQIVEQKNEYADAGTGIKASFQIESDEDSSQEFGQTFSSCFYVGQINIHNFDPARAFLADSSSLWVMTSFYLSDADWSSSEVLRENVRRRYGQEFIRMPRNPLTYNDILAVFEYQEKANPKQQFSDLLDAAGAIASGVTVFVPGVLYSHSVNFAVGIVKPEIQKLLLWDLNQYRANFAARSLPELVKVPPNSGVDGVVFFPKRPIPGYVDGHDVYISSFNSKGGTALVSGAYITQEQVSSATNIQTTASTTPTVTGISGNQPSATK